MWVFLFDSKDINSNKLPLCPVKQVLSLKQSQPK